MIRTYPKLEQFVTNLAYCALTEPDFLEICAATGIDWAWPKTFAGDTVLEFLALRDKLGPDRALDKMRPALRILENQIRDLSKMPSDLESLRIELRELSRVQVGIDIAHLILNDPESCERHLNRFQTFGSDGVATVGYSDLVEQYRFNKIEIAEKGPMVLLPGYEKTSMLIGGFDPGRLTLALASSGFGKTNLAMNLAFAAADKMAVGYMNLEMGIKDISSRAAVMRSRRTWREHHDNQISISEIERPPQHEIRFTTGVELHIDKIIAWAKAFKRTNPDFGFFVVDYDQKINVSVSRDTPEWKAVHVAVKELEKLAIELNIHVLVIAQFNRQGEIASSWRIINSAHTVIKFREHNGGVIVENSIKARYAKSPCAVHVDYDRAAAKIVESAPNDIFDLVDESSAQVVRTKTQATEQMFASRMQPKRSFHERDE